MCQTEPLNPQEELPIMTNFINIYEHMSGTFGDCYTLGKQVVVDEAMVKFNGRNSMKQYMQSKPIKRGIKQGLFAKHACPPMGYQL
ncbi:hypothetical protein DPMN_131078 [Dreissena polymorpha]|uniref:PiggyBac transposable element-derived protein domain-containing protein n=1 Tax=Dreissena polymorpha TaxID=45954 RepID=A0A9D4H5W0_DREPO|nr:hypothetical protein DPMN_131078 [Dreissena polymorpha]